MRKTGPDILYEPVLIKQTGQTGVIVDVDTDGETRPPVYFVEKDDPYKIGIFSEDCIWCRYDEVELL